MECDMEFVRLVAQEVVQEKVFTHMKYKCVNCEKTITVKKEG